jgi:phage replication O-like protein O
MFFFINNFEHKEIVMDNSNTETLYPFREPEDEFIKMPNCFIDEVMKTLKPNEFKVLIAIYRKTIGWRKINDYISNSQLMELTGIRSHSTLDKAVDGLVKKNMIFKISGNHSFSNYYAINTDFQVARTRKPDYLWGTELKEETICAMKEMMEENKKGELESGLHGSQEMTNELSETDYPDGLELAKDGIENNGEVSQEIALSESEFIHTKDSNTFLNTIEDKDKEQIKENEKPRETSSRMNLLNKDSSQTEPEDGKTCDKQKTLTNQHSQQGYLFDGTCPPECLDLAWEFYNWTGLTPNESEIEDWNDSFARLREFGLTDELFSDILSDLLAKRTPIDNPQSVEDVINSSAQEESQQSFAKSSDDWIEDDEQAHP